MGCQWCSESRFPIRIMVFDELELILFVSKGLTASLVMSIIELDIMIEKLHEKQ